MNRSSSARGAPHRSPFAHQEQPTSWRGCARTSYRRRTTACCASWWSTARLRGRYPACASGCAGRAISLARKEGRSLSWRPRSAVPSRQRTPAAPSPFATSLLTCDWSFRRYCRTASRRPIRAFTGSRQTSCGWFAWSPAGHSRMWRPGVVRAASLLLIAAPSLGAQVIRGRVTETGSSAPIAGALVSLLGETEDSSLVSVLTEQSGEYAVRAPSIGRYRLAVKRIGVKRFVSAPFELGSGETRVLDVPIDAVALTLPQVTVSGLCVTRSRELARVSSLWDEARTALEAAEISIRDRLIAAQIARYAAELEPGSLRVLFDWRSEAQVMAEQPFESLSGDSLSALGYWRSLPGDSVEFQGPDASALASNAFLRDHCFSLAPGMRNRPDLVGLSFVPARDRHLPDIAGTIWLDARRFELTFITFRYTQLPNMPNAVRIGGEAHYRRLESGAWIVDRWFIRMPQVVVRSDDWPRRQLRQEGGAVIAPEAPPAPQMASITGVFRDSAGRPEAG